MSAIPNGLYYTKEHAWVESKDGKITVGITDREQRALGDILFVELLQLGSTVTAGDSVGSLEAAAVVSEIFIPVTGEVIEVNSLMGEDPEVINSDPYGDGWMIRVKPSNLKELDDLMSADDYRKFVAEEDNY